MTGYVRKDTTNNIADGNVINAADLDAEFDGVQDAFNASTGHNHDGTTGEGAPITALGPTQDVTISATLLAPKTTNTVDIGSSALKFKDLFLAGNGSIGGTLAVTGVATLTAQPILSSLTASRAVFTDGSKGLVSNAITGTGNVVMSASPTLTGTVGGASLTLSSLTSGRVTYAGTSGLLQDDADLTFDGTTLSTAGLTASSTVTLSGGTANGVAYLNGSKVVTSGSALTFDGTNLLLGTTAALNTSATLRVKTASNPTAVAEFYGAGTNYSSKIVLANDANAAAVSAESGNLAFFTGGWTSEQMRLTSTGLGIGTSSPNEKLEVAGNAKLTGTNLSIVPSTATSAAYTLNTNTGGNFFLGIDSSTGASFTGTAYGRFLYSGGAYPIVFLTNDTERMRLDSSGNVGIGTSSPTNKLDILTGDNTGLSVRSTNYSGTFGPSGLGGMALTAAGAYPLFFYINGATRATLDSSGNLGLGVTPSAWGGMKAFQINGYGSAIAAWNTNRNTYILSNAYYDSSFKYSTTGAATYYNVSGENGSHSWHTAPSGTAGNAITFTQAMTLDASGQLGIGATSPAAKLQISSSSGGDTSGLRITRTDAGGGDWKIWSTATANGEGAGKLIFGTSSNYMTLDGSGNLLVGTTSASLNNSNSCILNVSPNAYSVTNHANGVSSATRYAYFGYNGSEIGSITQNGTTAVAYNTSSDYRLKNTIAPMTGALAKVALLKPVTYKWNADGSDGQGFIAHELAEVVPDCVTGEKDAVDADGNPQYQGIDTSFLVATLTAAIQELKAEFDAYKASHP